MRNRNLQFILGANMVFLMIAACVIPGRSLSPVPTIDPGQVQTSIAGTAQAAQTQTAVVLQVAVTDTPMGMTGTTIEQSQDGTTKYTDYDAGFEITFPVGWLAVRPNSDEFNAALTGEGAANQMLHDQMTLDMAGYNAELDRLFAYTIRPDIKKNIILGFSKLAWVSDDPTAMDNYMTGKLVDQLETSGDIPGFRASIVQLHEDGNIKMIEIGGRWSLSDGQGGGIPFFSTVYFFKPSPNSTVRVTFTHLQSYHDQVSQDVAFIMESIRILNP